LIRQKRFAILSARTISMLPSGVEALDSAHAVAFPLFVDLADLETNGRVREDIVLGSVGLGTALPRREFGPVCPICEHDGRCWWRDVKGKWH
jgi:hypothetical protein